MRSTFFGLNIGYKGLQAQQRALDVTSHNIANANTLGYTRQDVIMQASHPVKILEGYVGTGVDIAEFRRIRDSFLDLQLRTENKALGEWEVKANILGNLEVIFNEPSETSLRSVMDQYWAAWQDFSKNPESTAVRTTVMQNGVTLVDTFNHMDRQFADLQADISQSIAIKVDEINSIARQIGDLNEQIIKAEADGSKANDLRDRRDILVDQLSKTVDIEVIEDSLGSYNITIGGRSAVSRNFVTELRYVNNDSDPTAARIEWLDPLTGQSQGKVSIKGGALKGYLEMRDELVPKLRAEISLLAERIASEVNTLHRNGYDAYGQPGEDFFLKIDDSKPFSAANIKVNENIRDDTGKLAAAAVTPVLEGDGANALAIAQLRGNPIINQATSDDFYRSTVAKLGIYALEAGRMVENQTLLVSQLENKKESVSGVSLDEEMTNMIRFQHAYTASARVINAMDEMLEVIVNRLGLVGR